MIFLNSPFQTPNFCVSGNIRGCEVNYIIPQNRPSCTSAPRCYRYYDLRAQTELLMLPLPTDCTIPTQKEAGHCAPRRSSMGVLSNSAILAKGARCNRKPKPKEEYVEKKTSPYCRSPSSRRIGCCKGDTKILAMIRRNGRQYRSGWPQGQPSGLSE